MGLLNFILCAYGMTFILIYGSIFNPIRPAKGKLGELFHCPLCIGFWVGCFLFLINGGTELFTFEYTITNLFICGWLSAGTSYFLSMIVKDNGIQIGANDD